MELSNADLRILATALADRMEKLQIRQHLGDRDALKQSREAKALASRVESEIRDTAMIQTGDRFTVDDDGMMWA